MPADGTLAACSPRQDFGTSRFKGSHSSLADFAAVRNTGRRRSWVRTRYCSGRAKISASPQPPTSAHPAACLPRTAFLNALQMGFRSLAIEKRSGGVWQILGAVRNEFGKYNEVVDRLARQLNTAMKSVESLSVRTRAMDRKLR